ncbi:unnamed protein product [Phytomonas sp. EM1]|nr:unnamed protein product [Phytomonas sp. EM1]|eukprot:CCW59808.1 unnamed protein product [Phytomonas sp. isolate EM1]
MPKREAAPDSENFCHKSRSCRDGLAVGSFCTTKRRKIIHEADEYTTCFVDTYKQPIGREVIMMPQLSRPSAGAMREHFFRDLPCSWKEAFPLGYLVVIPHCFGDISFRMAAQQGVQPSTSLKTSRHSTIRYKFLAAAVAQARGEIGAVDTIPPYASLVVAFALQDAGHIEQSWDPENSVAISNSGDRKPLRGKKRECGAVIGLCIATEQDRAYHVQQSHPGSFTHGMPCGTSNNGAYFIGGESVGGALFCGIHLMWVALPFRGRGVAFEMIEVARRHISYGNVIAREHVAFLEPTASGSAFAQRYSGRSDFLIFTTTEF